MAAPSSGGPGGQLTPEVLGSQFWARVDEMIMQRLRPMTGMRPRFPSMIIGLAGSTPPIIGPLGSAGVTFNARIVAYQMFALTPGQLTIDIQISTPTTHAAATGNPAPLQFPSLIGENAGSLYPSISGAFTQNLDTSTWAYRRVNTGDMLHVWALASDKVISWAYLILFLQDMDEKVQTP